MGLSGAKKRTKLSSDPNNTAWSKSTSSFGHKILSAQGWKPGQLLGAENAAHAEHFTAANASHIRVMLREDNLGIGAQVGKSNADTFGLSTLSSIFGRLNGKSETEIEKMQHAQRDVELRSYQTRKFGHMTFVRGGLLVGDKMEDDTGVLQPPPSKAQTPIQTMRSAEKNAQNKHKKRKREHDTNDSKDDDNHSRRSTRKQIHDDHPAREQDGDTVTSSEACGHSSHEEKADRAAAKAEKRARKEERRKRREERATRREERRKRKSVTRDEGTLNAVTKPVTDPAISNVYDSGRQAFRQRFMQQKRLASMDSRALNEILMFKPAVA
ncbi:hypothetical protein AMS68_006448 [Peltaster fructicola]|uniref:PinX1-related protein 1 n=1 Tax=Peltaster fructicola TaxID=286661 RepID=A0A6H0Y1X8_9PEZI|nr:hypothetical protein AMS68_006448 [Peltaster fructicola]